MGDNVGTSSGNSQVTDVRWLLAGAFAGLLAAAFGILRQADSGDALPENAVARVNDQIISRDNYDRELQRVGTGRESEIDSAWLLQRLVDDELLVQRGLELGLIENVPALTPVTSKEYPQKAQRPE